MPNPGLKVKVFPVTPMAGLDVTQIKVLSCKPSRVRSCGGQGPGTRAMRKERDDQPDEHPP